MQFAIVMARKPALVGLPANESLFLTNASTKSTTGLPGTAGRADRTARRQGPIKRASAAAVVGRADEAGAYRGANSQAPVDLSRRTDHRAGHIIQKRIREFFKYYNQEKKATVILTSHYIEDVKTCASGPIIINQGRIVFDGDLHA